MARSNRLRVPRILRKGCRRVAKLTATLRIGRLRAMTARQNPQQQGPRAPRGRRDARRRGARLPRLRARASRRLPRRHRHRPGPDPQRRPRSELPQRRARSFSGDEPLLIAFAQHARHRPDRGRARPRGCSAASGNGTCRDGRVLPRLPARRRRRRALPGLLLAAHPAPCRARHADHLPCRLRRVLRHHREARRPDARRQAADHRRRQARRGVDRLLHRAHLRRALGDADVRGAGGSARTPPSSAPTWRNTPTSAARCAR